MTPRIAAHSEAVDENLLDVLTVPQHAVAGFVAACGSLDRDDLRASSFFMVCLLGPTPYGDRPIGQVTAEQILAAEHRVARRLSGWQLDGGDLTDPHNRMREHFYRRQRVTRQRAATQAAEVAAWSEATQAHRARELALLDESIREVMGLVPSPAERQA